jgi:hypothetical protein
MLEKWREMTAERCSLRHGARRWCSQLLQRGEGSPGVAHEREAEEGGGGGGGRVMHVVQEASVWKEEKEGGVVA